MYTQSMFYSKKKEEKCTPVNPGFTLQKWDVKGYELHGCVTIMFNLAVGDKVYAPWFGYNL